jgi:hypothetical protein
MVYLIARALRKHTMRANCCWIGLVVGLLPLLQAKSVQEPAPLQLHSGERIFFLGDSITDAGNSNQGYVVLVRQALQQSYAGLGIEGISAGVSGNKVPDLQRRLVCDLRQAFLAYFKEHNQTGKRRGVRTTAGVHLNDAGNRFVAQTILACLGARTGAKS